MGFKIVNKNSGAASIYVIRDGYSRSVAPFGSISLGELTPAEISKYKRYSAVGLYLESDNSDKPVMGMKGKDVKKAAEEAAKQQVAVVPAQPAPTVAPAAPVPAPVKLEPEVVQEAKQEPIPMPAPAEEKHEKPLEEMSAAELKGKAAEVGLDMTGIKKKKELFQALKALLGG